MLNDKLRLFYDRMNDAVAKHGMNPKAVADVIIAEAFPDTLSAASHEGADTMLRNGVIDFLSRHFKNSPKHHPSQTAFDFPEHVKPTWRAGRPTWGHIFYRAGWRFAGLTEKRLHILECLPEWISGRAA